MTPLQEARDAAPEWYEARKEQIRGAGYPQINAIPDLANADRPGQDLPLSRAETLTALAMFQADPRASLPTETPEEMRAWTQRQRQMVESAIPPADFLTDAEIAALRARFENARSRL